MNPLIKAEDLSKQYVIGGPQRYYSFRETLIEQFKAPLRWIKYGGRIRKDKKRIWALKDVSFEVKQGEVIGIIGRNGSGKSTLLKILSRITEPTKGKAEIRGRVASLLEVGTGFHPELTGRENIYLNGTILGMRKFEITRKFEEIVSFAETEKFIDTPVKHYSSGMHVRLAFAVAAHLNPEILLVDEVLAVGDVAFQKKCLGKMGDVAQGGRTILFVSHQMAAIKSLCNRAILLDGGHLVHSGNVDEIIDKYLKTETETSKTGIIPDNVQRLYSTDEAKFRRVQLSDVAGKPSSQFYLGQPFRVTLTLDVLKNIQDAVIEVSIVSLDGVHVTHSNSLDEGKPPIHLREGRHIINVDMNITLLPRVYSLLLGIHHLNGTTIDWIERALDFTIVNVGHNSSDHYQWESVRGYVRPIAHWNFTPSVQRAISSEKVI